MAMMYSRKCISAVCELNAEWDADGMCITIGLGGVVSTHVLYTSSNLHKYSNSPRLLPGNNRILRGSCFSSPAFSSHFVSRA
jgi:hypothetical protein